MLKTIGVILIIIFFVTVIVYCLKTLAGDFGDFKKRKVRIICAIIAMLMSGRNLHIVLAKTYEARNAYKKESEQTASFENILTQIEFENEVINDENVIWERFFLDNLHFSIYDHQIEKEPLREAYKVNIVENRNVLTTPLEELISAIEYQQNRGFLMQTTRTLEEVSSDIPESEKRYNASPKLFEEEFILRALDCTSDSTFEKVYQTGRAADDAFKQYVNGGTATVKQKIFFAAMAISYYEQCLSKSENALPLKISFIEYRIAEIYIYLYETRNFNAEHTLHFLLSAESYLKRSKATIVDESIPAQEVDAAQPYSDYYLALLQYDLLTMYDYDGQNMINECITYAISYKNKPNAKEKCKNSCDFFLAKLSSR